MVLPPGISRLALSTSTWIHWWSPVASANLSIMAWSTVIQSEGPSSCPMCCCKSRGYSTVSGFMGRLLGGEALALVGKAVEQGGPLPDVAVPALELEYSIADDLQPEGIGPKHGAAAVHRPTVAVDPDHVDVAGPDGQLLFQDLGSLVDHRIEEPGQDLVV